MGVDAVLQENPPILDIKQMSAAQQQDPDILKLQTSSCFEVPLTITTDRGCQFESTLWKQLIGF